jgi:uncharacterized protein YyaL (SSP411 family)
MIDLRSALITLAFTLSGFSASGLAAESKNTPATPQSQSGPYRYTNRLIDSANPYLLLHAHNPVDWYPWGPEALAKAKKENKPIFLSVGYSTCYWCHVAEKKLYSDPDIAALMNQWFINIKVDREQRTDIDQVYMLATRLMTGAGGWPNNVFLTTDLKPFFAGSYFPPEDGSFGHPGFPTILKSLNRAWTTDHQHVIDQAEKVYEAMQQTQKQVNSGEATPVRNEQWIAKARESLSERYDSDAGGFSGGRGTKFPQVPMLNLLLADYRANHGRQSLFMLEKTLDAMALGGIYDHLGGGFHRYSTEPSWSIPHFEKMLYDNAQLLKIYAQAYQLTKNPLYKDVAMSVSHYLNSQMLAPDGGFYTAQDAEVDGEEGASYVWTRQQIISVLGEDAARKFLKVYELTSMPEQGSEQLLSGEHRGVLRVRASFAPQSNQKDSAVDSLNAVAPLRAKLLEARNRRPQPLRDEKIVAGLNGLAIDALAHGGRIIGNDHDIVTAKRTAERMWTAAYDPLTHQLMHEIFRGRAQTEAYLDDFALLGVGFMSLYDVANNKIWLKRAAIMADDIMHQFEGANGALATTPHAKDLLIAPEDDGDNVYPSGSSATVDLLLRLNAATKEPRYAAAAKRVVGPLGRIVEQHPSGWGTLLAAVSLHPLGGAPELAANAANAADAASSANIFSLPSTADHVHVTASRSTRGSHDEIITKLKIDDGWHVNANPASFDYLIPTSVAFDGLSATDVVYPMAVLIKPQFAPDGLKVYAGTVNVVSVFPKGALNNRKSIQATVSVQACSDIVCLPPAKLPATVQGEGGP